MFSARYAGTNRLAGVSVTPMRIDSINQNGYRPPHCRLEDAGATPYLYEPRR